MLNLARKVTLLLFGLTLGIIYQILPAESHHQGDFFPIAKQHYKLELQAERTGEWRWSYEQRCNQGDIRADVAGAFSDTETRYSIRSTQLTPSNAPLNIQNNVSTCGADFTGRCGAGFAVACVGADGARFPVNCDAYYDGPYMATFWSFESRKSVVKHEYTHCRDGRAEGYCDIQESRAPCNTGVTCQPSPTIMGCGPNHPLDYSSYDDAAFRLRHYPPKLTSLGYGFNGSWYTYACGLNDPKYEMVTHIAVLANFFGPTIQWTGVTIEIPYNSTTGKRGDSNGCIGIGPREGLDIIIGARYFLLPENKLSNFRNPVETLVP